MRRLINGLAGCIIGAGVGSLVWVVIDLSILAYEYFQHKGIPWQVWVVVVPTLTFGVYGVTQQDKEDRDGQD